tara:strand:+ start:259 stop:1143 length:885 start_codon:yes stop_codon:yes gene_type:complete
MNKNFNNKDTKYFSLYKPLSKHQKPFIVSSPHSGNIFLNGSDIFKIKNPKKYLYMQDIYINDMIYGFHNHGISVLKNYISRLVIDLNRSKEEIDSKFIKDIPNDYKISISSKVKAGLGLIPFKDILGKKIYEEKLPWTEVCFRIEKFYNPWHLILKEQIKELSQVFDFVFIIDLHSMPSKDALGNKVSDFVIGNNFDISSSKLSREILGDIIKSKGYSCSYNKPYSGGYITTNYSDIEKNIECIQIEINKSLYIDESTYQKSNNYKKFNKNLQDIILEFFNLIYSKNNNKIAAE